MWQSIERKMRLKKLGKKGSDCSREWSSPSCLFWSIRELIDTGEGGGGAGDDVGDTGDMVR